MILNKIVNTELETMEKEAVVNYFLSTISEFAWRDKPRKVSVRINSVPAKI
jgi:hypothetical protein